MKNKKHFKNFSQAAVNSRHLFFRSSILSFLCFFVLLFFCSSVAHVFAIEYGMLGGKPANPDPNIPHGTTWFMYNLGPGEAKEDAVEVMNLYKDSWDALIYAADTTKSSSGGFALKQFDEPKQGVGVWVKFYPDNPPDFFKGLFEKKGKKILDFCAMSRDDLEKEIQPKKGAKITIADEKFQELETWCQGVDLIQKKLEPQEHLIIPFLIRVPEDVDVGEHTGGVLIEKVNPDVENSGSGSSIKLTTRVGVRIYETVPGEIVKKLTLTDFKVIKNFKEFDFSNWFSKDKKPEEYLVQSQIVNDGNVSIDNENIVHVKDLLFRKRNEDISRKFQALKKDQFVSNLAWNNPRFGRFSFSTEIKYQDASGNNVTLTSPEIKIWIIPWKEITVAAVLLLLALGGWWGWKIYHKKKYGGAGWVEYTVTEGDDINKLAQKFNVSWKVLAKTNKLKAPYLLEPGKTILAPPFPGKEENKSQKETPAESPNACASENKPAFAETSEGEPTLEQKIASIYLPEVQKDEVVKEETEETKFSWWKKIIPDKKTILIAGGVIIFAALILVIVWLAKENVKYKEINAKLSITSMGGGSKEIEEPKKAEEEKAEAITPASEEKKIMPAEISVKVLNGGAAPGVAGKIKDFLVEKGYAKAEATNAEERDKTGTTVFYQDDKFKEETEKIAKLLKDENLKAAVKKAVSDEEKSADIVVVLGK